MSIPDKRTAATFIIEQQNSRQALDLKTVFNRSEPPELEIDLGCGKGRFLIARAFANRSVCFLGIDRRKKRIEKVARAALRLQLENIRLLCGENFQTVENLIPNSCVKTYYLFFPDPWPKRRHHRRRLFHASFLDAIHRTLCAGGKIHIATDHIDYFEIIRRILSNDCRFEECETFIPAENERTNFEIIFLSQNKPIGRCSFRKKAI